MRATTKEPLHFFDRSGDVPVADLGGLDGRWSSLYTVGSPNPVATKKKTGGQESPPSYRRVANIGLTNLARPTIRFLVGALRGEAGGCTVRVAASVREALETRAGVDIDYTHPSARYANDTA